MSEVEVELALRRARAPASASWLVVAAREVDRTALVPAASEVLPADSVLRAEVIAPAVVEPVVLVLASDDMATGVYASSTTSA